MNYSKINLLALGAIFGLVFWVGLLYPLLPNSPIGWVACIASGAMLGICVVMSVFLTNWLQRQRRLRMICQGIAFVVALSVGCGIFWLAASGQSFIVANFSYFGR